MSTDVAAMGLDVSGLNLSVNIGIQILKPKISLILFLALPFVDLTISLNRFA